MLSNKKRELRLITPNILPGASANKKARKFEMSVINDYKLLIHANLYEILIEMFLPRALFRFTFKDLYQAELVYI